MIRHSAFRVRATSAGVPAHRVHASLLRRTLAVPGALDVEDGLRGATGSAAAAHVAAGADADHGANGVGGQDPALGRFAAGLDGGAWVLALVAEAGQGIGAVGVFLALGSHLGFAIQVGIARVADRTATYRQMIEDPALS